jgi:hypothetical protein
MVALKPLAIYTFMLVFPNIYKSILEVHYGFFSR